MKLSGSGSFVRFLLRVRPAPLAVLLKRLLRIRRETVDTPMGKFWIDPVSNLGVALVHAGTYEPGMQAILERCLGPGKVFVDLGANEGYFTVLAARLTQPSGRVLAIEPQNRLIPIIETNLRINSLDATIVHAAVSDHSAVVTLHLAPDTNTGSSSLHRATKYRVPTHPVSSLTLADVLNRNQIAKVDLLKVDIEGFEYEAILGSQELFNQKRIKAMALELHSAALEARGRSVNELTSFSRTCGL